jgi:hypothetical protein
MSIEIRKTRKKASHWFEILGDTTIVHINHKRRTVKSYIGTKDLPKVEKYSTFFLDKDGYVKCQKVLKGKKYRVRLSRLVTDCPTDMVADHLNHDVLDNRQANLRVCTRAENDRNRQIPGKGYSFHKRSGKWQAWVKVDGKSKSLGYYAEEAEAAAVARQARVDLGYFNVPKPLAN